MSRHPVVPRIGWLFLLTAAAAALSCSGDPLYGPSDGGLALGKGKPGGGTPPSGTTLLPQPGGVRSSAADVNDEGVVVGSMFDSRDVVYAMRWTSTGTEWQAENLGAGRAAVAVNRGGEILLRQHDRKLGWRSWVRAPDGTEFDLGPNSYGNGLADDGTVIGSRDGGYGVWERSGPGAWGSFAAMPPMAGYQTSDLNDISADGRWIVGHVFDQAAREWAVAWRRDATGWGPPSLVDAGMSGSALAVNGSGASAGAVWPCGDGSCSSLPVRWPAPGGARTLLESDGWAMVEGMNEAGAVVGQASQRVESKGKPRTALIPALWRPGSTAPVSLGNAGVAYAISNTGLAVGKETSGSDRAVVWTVP